MEMPNVYKRRCCVGACGPFSQYLQEVLFLHTFFSSLFPFFILLLCLLFIKAPEGRRYKACIYNTCVVLAAENQVT